ncbi:DUF6252 family protein [Algivirga pacifica]|uniref:Lipocalin-like domain-containing protein n=1 Tax=Algivirga pacifica TaxID=1162670 RepID=A0ABP9DI26_9BACT
MRKAFIFPIVASLFLCLFSCEDAYYNPETKSISAEISGDQFNSTDFFAVKNGKTLSISASQSSKQLTMVLNKFEGEGEYVLGGDANNNEATWEPALGGTFTTLNMTIISGKVKVDEFDGSSIKGTFQYVASNGSKEVSVEEGIINILLTTPIE